jgi:hypothetical protein
MLCYRQCFVIDNAAAKISRAPKLSCDPILRHIGRNTMCNFASLTPGFWPVLLRMVAIFDPNADRSEHSDGLDGFHPRTGQQAGVAKKSPFSAKFTARCG